MSTAAKIETDWTEIACAGKPYGHVPGHQYHDVEIHTRPMSGGRVLARVTEVWGSAQGYDEEHGRREWTARGSSAEDAIDAAVRHARSEIDLNDETVRGYLSTAHSSALNEVC